MDRAVNPDVLEAFDAVIARLTPKGAWIQKTYARTSRRGRSVGVRDPQAKCWCLQGALFTCPLEFQRALAQALISVLPPPYVNPIVVWNDKRGRTQAEVIDLLHRARDAYAARGEHS